MKAKHVCQSCVLYAALCLNGCGVLIPPVDGNDNGKGDIPGTHRLVSATWLNEHMDDENLVVIDARPTSEYMAGHIPGAVSASFSPEEADSYGIDVSYGGGIDFFVDPWADVPFQDGPPQIIQDAVRRFGISEGNTVVVYDAGGHFHAARFFWTLTRHGFTNIVILDGGLREWTAQGGETSTVRTEPERGDFVAADPDVTNVATTDDVFEAISDPDVVLVSGLTPSWHYGSYVAYTEGGHIPTTIDIPLGYFFNADGTWRSVASLETLLGVEGITPDKTVITYCGGNPLSAAVYFTFAHVLEFPHVQNYTGSYLAWIEDPRNLPVNLYGNDDWLRGTDWLEWWIGERMQRLMPASPAIAVDVRSYEEYQSGHIPWSVNVDASDTETVLSRAPTAWGEELGANGVGDAFEAVIVDEAVTPRATLMFWLLHHLGHQEASIAAEGLAGWTTAGNETSTEDTIIADATTPIDVAIQPQSFTSNVNETVRLRSIDEQTDYPYSRVWIVSSVELPAELPFDSYIHVPWTQTVTEEGILKSAGSLWSLYDGADVPRFSELVCYSEDPAEATVHYFALNILGYPRVLVYAP